MKSLKILNNIILILIFSFFSFNIFSQKISQEEKLFGLSKLWSEITYNYPYYEYIPFDFDSLYMEYTTKVIQTENDYEYYRLLQRFVCSLHEGHTTVAFPQGINNVSQYQMWCYYSYKDNKIYVIRNGFYENGEILNEKKTSANFFDNVEVPDKIPIGSEVLSINKVPVLKYIDSVIFPYVPVRKEIRYKYISERLFWGYMKDTVITIDFKFPTGENKTLIMKRIKGVCPRWNKGHYAYYPKKKMDFLQDSSIFYVHFENFLDMGFLYDFLNKGEIIREKSKGLIIDLRHCIGGSDYNQYLLHCFSSDSVYYDIYEKRINDAILRRPIHNVKKDSILDPQSKNYQRWLCANNRLYEKINSRITIHYLEDKYKVKCQIIILIDEATASAAEYFIYGLKQVTKNFIIIGTPSYGSCGTPIKASLPIEGEGNIVSSRILNPDGSIFKNFDPDIFFEPTIEDIISGKDATLEIAVKYILNKNN